MFFASPRLFRTDGLNIQKHCAADPEFRFTGNKKYHQLNKEVLETIDEVLATDDSKDRTKKLPEVKDLLMERNKHILLAEKYC